MNITEVRVKLMRGRSDRLRAFCSITIDDDFVVHDLRVIEGRKGFFVAMPSRKLTDNCPRCGGKNDLRASYCGECGASLDEDRAEDQDKIHVDVAHPINTDCREMIQQKVLDAYEAELATVKEEQGEQPAEAPPEPRPEEEAAEAEEEEHVAEEEEEEAEEEAYAEAEEEEYAEVEEEEYAEVEEEEYAEVEEAVAEGFAAGIVEEELDEEPTKEIVEPPEEVLEKEEDVANVVESALAEEDPYVSGPALHGQGVGPEEAAPYFTEDDLDQPVDEEEEIPVFEPEPEPVEEPAPEPEPAAAEEDQEEEETEEEKEKEYRPSRGGRRHPSGGFGEGIL